MQAEFIDKLREEIPLNRLSTNDVDRMPYSGHTSPGPDGMIYEVEPNAVVMPKNEEEVAFILRACNEFEVPATPSGGLTSFYGARATENNITIDMGLMNDIIKIDEDDMVAVTEGGCSTYKLMFRAEKEGLRVPIGTWYTPGPQLGSAIACNITGHYMTKYGDFGRNVIGLKAVLPSGKVIKTGLTRNNKPQEYYHRHTGFPDVTNLFLNSAGTMGVITEVAPRLVEKPEVEEVMGWYFPRDEAESVEKTVHELQKKEMYDVFLADFWNLVPVEKYTIPEDLHFIVYAHAAGNDESFVEARKEMADNIAKENGGKELEKLPQLLFGSPEYRAWKGISSWINKRVVEFYWYNATTQFAEVYDFWEKTARKYDYWDEEHIPGWYAFVDTQSINPWPGIWYDFKEEGEIKKMKSWYREVVKGLAKRGCAPYLVGRSYLPEMYDVIDDGTLELLNEIRDVVDPKKIMNRGILEAEHD